MARSNIAPVLAALAERINAAHAEAEASMSKGMQHAADAGRLLTEAKGAVPHGEWLPWLKANVSFSERTAQAYMRVSKRVAGLDPTKAQRVADLPLRQALAELVERRPPRVLPLAGHVRIGTCEREGSIVEIWIAPSAQHHNHFYVTTICTDTINESDIVGIRRPARADGDFVLAIVTEMAGDDLDAFEWRDRSFAPWPYNLLLYKSADNFIDGLAGKDDPDDFQDLAEIANSIAPDGLPVYVRAKAHHEEAPVAFWKMVFEHADS